jgi:hypothetical protein
VRCRNWKPRYLFGVGVHKYFGVAGVSLVIFPRDLCSFAESTKYAVSNETRLHFQMQIWRKFRSVFPEQSRANFS